jgi:NhaA family Na+:H+ antiporter
MRFLHIEAMAGIILLLSTFLALAIANSPWSGPFIALWDTPTGV